MKQVSPADRRIVSSLWTAAVLTAVGGVLPFALGGGSSRIAAVVVPFWAAAIALGLCAVLQSHGRTIASTLYFVAGIAILYGLLSMFSLPVRLSALGACPVPPQPCTSGLPLPLTDGEVIGMEAASVLGIVAILVGYYGLVMLYRRRPVAPAAPPVRRIPPIAPARPADVEEPELPAHLEAERPELPAHESSPASS